MRLVALALLLATLPCWGERVFVRNRPFPGRTVGQGSQLLVELGALLTALEMPRPGDLEVVERNGLELVNLADFARRTGARLVTNPQLQTVDVNLPRARREWVLVHYTANWCGPCRQLQPSLERASHELDLLLLTVDLDRESPERTRYLPYFEGRRLPFLVLFDPRGRPVGRWSGSPGYSQLLAELSRARGR